MRRFDLSHNYNDITTLGMQYDSSSKFILSAFKIDLHYETFYIRTCILQG